MKINSKNHLHYKDKISVIIPTFNRKKELLKAIYSVLNQTYPVFEILICDDGSTDNSKDEVLGLNNPKLIWIDCGKNGGPAVPRNEGIKKSKGDWIAFLDSDDEWLPAKIEKQLIAAKTKNAQVVCSNAFRFRNEKNEGLYSDYKKNTITFDDLLIGNYVICSSVFVNKRFLNNISLFPEAKKFIAIEDYALWLRISTKTSFFYLNEGLLNYSDSFETSIRTNYKDSWIIFDIVLSDLKLWVKKNKMKISNEQKKALNEKIKYNRNKGIPTAWDNFKYRITSKLKILNK